ncbi:hypothetical protein [Guyparkeria halopsychrophila]|uniref:hypothetical protein n=1 Tax=Guyparkeria halopsychrophila TaxID=3139421 RepID=UPI0037C8C915
MTPFQHHLAPFDKVLAHVAVAKEAKPAPGLVRAMTCACPAHKDKRPSLLVSETDDGRVLMHCRAGCSFDEIRRGLGLELIDLIPEHLRHARNDANRSPHKGPRFSPWAALQALAVDVITVALAAAQIRREGWIDDADFEALMQAEARIQNTVQAGGFQR